MGWEGEKRERQEELIGGHCVCPSRKPWLGLGGGGEVIQEVRGMGQAWDSKWQPRENEASKRVAGFLSWGNAHSKQHSIVTAYTTRSQSPALPTTSC